MEEDLEILEELINASKEYNQYEGNKYYKSIENLIARYKELEQKYSNKLISFQKEREEYEKCLEAEESYSKSLNNDIKSLLHIEPNDNFIPKSKVKEKIEELQKEYKKISKENFINKIETQKVLSAQIVAYKKLLED